MSELYVKNHRIGHRHKKFLLGAMLAIILFALWMLPRTIAVPISVTINGQRVSTHSRMTLEELAQQYAATAVPGDLISVTGKLLKAGGGEPPTFIVDGERKDIEYKLHPGDVIEAHRGVDTTEDAKRKVTEIEPGFIKVGGGPFPKVTTPGVIGETVVQFGQVSAEKTESVTAVEPRSPQVTYYNASKARPRLVALTFDDGPNPGETDAILRVLRREKVKATFFALGRNVEKHPDLAKQIVDQGHQIGIHSYGHHAYSTLSAREIKKDATKARRVIKKATGLTVTWIRPPYGLVDGVVYCTLDNLDMNVALWNVDSLDYTRPGFQSIINRVYFGRQPGAVVLMHDGGGDRSDTVRALSGIIGEYRDKGYEFVTVQEMAERIPELN